MFDEGRANHDTHELNLAISADSLYLVVSIQGQREAILHASFFTSLYIFLLRA